MAHQLDKDTVGYLTYKASRQSSMTTTISKDTPTYNIRSSIVLGIPHSYLSLSYEHKLQKHSGRLRGLVKWVQLSISMIFFFEGFTSISMEWVSKGFFGIFIKSFEVHSWTSLEETDNIYLQIFRLYKIGVLKEFWWFLEREPLVPSSSTVFSVKCRSTVHWPSQCQLEFLLVSIWRSSKYLTFLSAPW